MKKKTFKMDGNWLSIAYLVALMASVLLVLAILATRKGYATDTNSGAYTSIDQEWTLESSGDTSVDINALGSYFEDGSDTLSIYYQTPEMEQDTCLIYRSKDVYTEIWLDNEKIYETQCFESPFYLKSPGNNWNFVIIPSKYATQTLEMRVRYVYDTSAVSVDHFYVGDKASWIMEFFMSKVLAILLSLLIVFFGVISLALERSSFKRSGKHSLLYLGIYAVLLGTWSLLETNTLQLFARDGRLLQLVDNLLMITDSLPLFFYLDAEFDIMKRIIPKFLCFLDVAYISFCVIGQALGLIDIHNHLVGSWIGTFLAFFMLVGILIKQIIGWIKTQKIQTSILLQVVGACALMFLVITAVPVYAKTDGMDRAETMRVGMLVMIILFGAAGQLQVYELIRQGSRYEIVKSLAYQDGLTGLHNRTSYLEDLERFKTNQPEALGMVFFDVNNLKGANDTYGHEIGDQLICSVADAIDASFEMYGIAYRTGGDEFIVFLECENPQDAYEECMTAFQAEIDMINKKKSFPFRVQVAQGFALREEPTEDALNRMVKQADDNMYENKKLLKAQKA